MNDSYSNLHIATERRLQVARERITELRFENELKKLVGDDKPQLSFVPRNKFTSS